MNNVGFESEELYPQAEQLANEFGFIINNIDLPRLSITKDKLVLLSNDFAPMYIDFTDPIWLKRSHEGKKQHLVRACKPNPNLKILDLTAGWGRDASVLAYSGAHVLMLERNPVMAALLQDAVKRLQSDLSLQLRLDFIHTDAFIYLETLTQEYFPDVIYIDPMHPSRQKSALVKKDMQVLQDLVGPSEDGYDLVALARSRTNGRVVVKWPKRLPPLCPPDIQYSGSTVRFDVFFPRVAK